MLGKILIRCFLASGLINLAVSVSPGYAQLNLALKANEALRKNHLQSALEYANLAITANPKDAAALAVRGKIYFAREKFPDALHDFDQALTINPNFAKINGDCELYLQRAQCHIEAGELPLSERDLRAAIGISPSSTEYKFLAEVYCQQNKLDLAIESFTKSIQLDPKNIWIYKERGASYMQAKNYPKAIADFTKMIELHPNEPIGYISRAEVYEMIGKSSLAKKDNERAKGLTRLEE